MYSDEDKLEDLKQFISTTVLQSESHIKNELKTELVSKQDLEKLGLEVMEGFGGVGEAIGALSDHIDECFNMVDAKLDDHEVRISSLEQQAA